MPLPPDGGGIFASETLHPLEVVRCPEEVSKIQISQESEELAAQSRFYEEIGRATVAAGRTVSMRAKYHLSIRKFAEILGMASQVIAKWEANPSASARMRVESAIRIGALVEHATQVEEKLAHQGVMQEDLLPIRRITAVLGLSPSSKLIADKCRSGELTCFSLGRFGVYVPKIEAESLLHREK